MTKCLSFRYGSVYRRLFKKRWGVDKGLTQDHHVIPRKFKDHDVVQRIQYDMNSSKNLVIMPTHYGIDKLNVRQDRLVHYGGHPAYDEFVFASLESMNSISNDGIVDAYMSMYVTFLKRHLRSGSGSVIPWR